MGILTKQEAAEALYLESAEDYPRLNILLPAIDAYIKKATGVDYGTGPADPLAKLAATMLLVQWFENPAMIGNEDNMHFGVQNLLAQLKEGI